MFNTATVNRVSDYELIFSQLFSIDKLIQITFIFLIAKFHLLSIGAVLHPQMFNDLKYKFA